jgi:hypothetical protein
VQPGLVSGTTWSRMVNGAILACTGVEPYLSDPSSNYSAPHSAGWFWGPCA